MNPVVLDCSVAMAWFFEDECDAFADAVLDALPERETCVPSLWPVEVANLLLAAERRARLSSADSARFIELVGGLPIAVDSHAHQRVLGTVLSIGRELGTSADDATYLELAMRIGASLATRDDRLRAAAVAAGIPVFEPTRRSEATTS